MHLLRCAALTLLSSLLPTLTAAQTVARTPPAAHSNAPQLPASAPAAAPLDINTATFGQLRALPGFGAVYARRVIAGRPYTAKNQLLTRGVLPLAAYNEVSARIVAHRIHK